MPKKIPAEALIGLQQRLAGLPARSSERRRVLRDTAELYGICEQSLYRALAQRLRPKALRRSDRGIPRVLPLEELEHYCEVIAAMKVRTSNKKGRHLSTSEAIRLLEEFGVQTSQGLLKIPPCTLKLSTVTRYLRQWGYDKATWTRQPVAVRFQAEHSNECWQFDLSPSDLKHIEEPSWVRPDRGTPTLMLFSIVDGRSGAAYQEYRCVYGEDVEVALRFLFSAMAPKAVEDVPWGVPVMLYMDKRSHCEKPDFPAGNGVLEHRDTDAPAGRQGWAPRDGPVEGKGGKALPHRQGNARDALSFPRSQS